MRLKDNIVFHVRLVFLFVAIVVLAITVRIFQLQFFSSKYEHISKYDTLTVYPLRGNILASDGEILSTTQTRYKISTDLCSEALNKDILERYIEALSDSLSQVFPSKTKEDYLRILRNARDSRKHYLLIKSNVSLDDYNRVKKFPIFNKGRFRGGFIAEIEDKRTLPYKDVAERTIGKNGISAIGLEGWYNTHLQGEKERIVVQRISNNKVIVDEECETYNDFAIRSGKDVISTINIKWQDYAHQILLEQAKAIPADTATVILMEVKTGDIKVIANIIKSSKNKYRERSNFAVAGRIEPGSTFKLASMMVALKDRKFDLNESVNTGYARSKTISGANITEAGSHGYGKLSVRQVFEKSSNIGTAMLINKGYKNNREDFISGLDNLNLNYKTGIDVHGEAEPRIKPLSKWQRSTLPYLAIGYQVELTPLQILTFYNAVANNGVYVKPRLVREIRHYGKTVEKFDTEKRRKIADIKTIRKIQLMLKGVVEKGTAKRIRSRQYKIAGKTGTSQVAMGKKGYRRGADSSVIHYGSFAGYFPADNPEYSCIVVLKTKSKSRFYGGDIAAPIFRKLADKVYATSPKFRKKITKRTKNKDIPYAKVGYKQDLNSVYARLRIPIKGRLKTKSSWIYTDEKSNLVEYKTRKIEKGKVPRVVGMGLKDALFLAESSGLNTRVKGRGTVIKQSLKAGEKIDKRKTIELILR